MSGVVGEGLGERAGFLGDLARQDHEVEALFDRRRRQDDLRRVARLPIEGGEQVALLDRAERTFTQFMAVDEEVIAAYRRGTSEAAAKAKGVKRVCIPNRSTKSKERRREQKKRWFRNGQKWRTGCEGRISVIKRRHGLTRCRYKGEVGMRRWVGLGIIADNLVNIGRALQGQARQ